MMRRLDKLETGFTLVELTISVAILAAIFLLITNTFISLLHFQQSIISIRTTNQVVRTAFSTLSTDTRLGVTAEVITDANGFDQVCIRQPSKMLQYFVADNGSGKNGVYIRELGLTDPCDEKTSVIAKDNSVTSLDTDVVQFQVWLSSSGSATGVTAMLGVAMDRNLLGSGGGTTGNNVCHANLSPYCSVTTMQTSIALKGVAN